MRSTPQFSAGAVFTNDGDKETTIPARQTLTRQLTFSAKTLEGLSPGKYYLVLRTDGVQLQAANVEVTVK